MTANCRCICRPDQVLPGHDVRLIVTSRRIQNPSGMKRYSPFPKKVTFPRSLSLLSPGPSAVPAFPFPAPLPRFAPPLLSDNGDSTLRSVGRATRDSVSLVTGIEADATISGKGFAFSFGKSISILPTINLQHGVQAVFKECQQYANFAEGVQHFQ